MSNKSWILEVNRTTGTDDYFIELNDEILAETGFKIGDELEWADRGDGSWSLKKKVENEFAEFQNDLNDFLSNKAGFTVKTIDEVL
jgi:hypothetical protein